MADGTEMNVEAERAAFEAWHRSRFATKHSTGQPTRDMHNGVYAEDYGPENQQQMWEAWQASRRAAKPADVGAGELPKPEVKIERGRVWIVKGNQSFMLAYEPDADDPEMAEWYAKQLRCVLSGFTPCVNSTAQGEQPQQAAQGVKTWRERKAEQRFAYPDLDHMLAEIAELRAKLRRYE